MRKQRKTIILEESTGHEKCLNKRSGLMTHSTLKKRLAHASQDKKKRTMGAHGESRKKRLVPAALSWKRAMRDDLLT